MDVIQGLSAVLVVIVCGVVLWVTIELCNK
jgi:hypothetical protein